MPTFNRVGFLSEAIGSLLKQTRPVDQIIIWDDGSTDTTQELIAQNFKDEVTYFNAPNQGKSAALNSALKHASGDYIWICDDDDIAAPYAAERLGTVLDNTPEIGLVSGSYQRFSDLDGTRVHSDAGYWPDLSSGSPLRHILEDIFLFQHATLVRKTCYDQVGPFNEALPRSIDYDMLVRLAVKFPVKVLDEVLFYQRKHEGVRGPVGAQHDAASSEDHWSKNDRKIFADLRDDIPLSIYTSMYQSQNPELARRAGHLQRGCVYARRNDWPNALLDFQGAAKILGQKPLTPLEVQICRRAVSGKHGVHPQPSDMDQLGLLSRLSPAGGSISRSLSRGLVWSIRQAITQRDLGTFKRLGLLALKLGIGRTQTAPESEIKELSTLPIEAYNW